MLNRFRPETVHLPALRHLACAALAVSLVAGPCAGVASAIEGNPYALLRARQAVYDMNGVAGQIYVYPNTIEPDLAGQHVSSVYLFGYPNETLNYIETGWRIRGLTDYYYDPPAYFIQAEREGFPILDFTGELVSPYTWFNAQIYSSNGYSTYYVGKNNTIYKTLVTNFTVARPSSQAERRNLWDENRASFHNLQWRPRYCTWGLWTSELTYSEDADPGYGYVMRSFSSWYTYED